MKVKPICKKCGNSHFNFVACQRIDEFDDKVKENVRVAATKTVAPAWKSETNRVVGIAGQRAWGNTTFAAIPTSRRLVNGPVWAAAPPSVPNRRTDDGPPEAA